MNAAWRWWTRTIKWCSSYPLRAVAPKQLAVRAGIALSLESPVAPLCVCVCVWMHVISWRQCNHVKALIQGWSFMCLFCSPCRLVAAVCQAYGEGDFSYAGPSSGCNAPPPLPLLPAPPPPKPTHRHILMTNVPLPSFNINFNYGPIMAACPRWPAAVCNNKRAVGPEATALDITPYFLSFVSRLT